MKNWSLRKGSVLLLTVLLMLSVFFSGGVFANEETDTVSISAGDQIQAQYRGHIQNKGDIPSQAGSFMAGGQELGSRGEGLRLEGISIKLSGNLPEGAGITYQVHVQDKGWMDPVSDGALAGTTGEGLRIEAIRINLVGLDDYDVLYRGHVQNYGDLPSVDGAWNWARNGEELGTNGEGLRLEAIQIRIQKKVTDVGLGDSIAYGMSADPGQGYVDLLYDNLSEQEGNEDLTLCNRSVPGLTTAGLLTQLQTDTQTIQALSNAKTVTISIGGNNLLQPLIQTMATAFGLDPSSETFAADMASALQQEGAQDIINGALPDLQTNLTAGTQAFASEFHQIVAAVKTLAPEATIYVATLYNPLNSQDPLYPVFEPFIQQMNALVMAPDSGYLVADVYTAFNAYQGAEPLVNFNWYLGQIDPHPTTAGHIVIYESHLSAVAIVS